MCDTAKEMSKCAMSKLLEVDGENATSILARCVVDTSEGTVWCTTRWHDEDGMEYHDV